MIKIVSGHSYATGSTVALVNLCNQFNSRGYPCILYGPDHWHLDKCRSGFLSDFRLEDDNIVIVHDIAMISPSDLNNLSSIILETTRERLQRTLRNLFASGNQNDVRLYLTLPCHDPGDVHVRYSPYSKIHFASSRHPGFARVKQPKFVCPNFLCDLSPSVSKAIRAAGVIGDIRKEYGVESAIENAMRDGMETVTLYGYLADPIYFYGQIVPLTKKYPGKIKMAGFLDDRQKVYDSVSDVYSAVSQPCDMIVRECVLTDTHYHGPDAAEGCESLTNDQIFSMWEKELQLNYPEGRQ